MILYTPSLIIGWDHLPQSPVSVIYAPWAGVHSISKIVKHLKL